MLRVPLLQDHAIISKDLIQRQKKRDETVQEILIELRRKQAGRQNAFYAMFFLTGCYCLLEFGVGIYSGSLALISDGFHMLSDFIALIVGFAAVKYASYESKDPSMTYGYARAEVLGALVNATALLAICFTIMVEAIQRFFHAEEHVDRCELVLWVGTAGLFINLTGMCIFGECCECHSHDHHHHHCDPEDDHDHESDAETLAETFNAFFHHSHSINSSFGYSKKDQEIRKQLHSCHSYHGHSHSISEKRNMNMRGVYLHILGDALGSVVVIISAVVMEYTDWEYRHYADPVCSLLIVWIIAISTWPLFIESAKILAQKADYEVDVHHIRRSLARHECIVDLHELHVWCLAGNKNIGSVHLTLDMKKFSDEDDKLLQIKQIQEFAKKVFHDNGVHSSSIQIEFSYFGEIGCTDKLCSNNKACLKNQCCLVEDRSWKTSSSVD